ncbi:hypothetical protein CALCODRAFT_501265 [Calocera cornea HHB12733]|uniref:STB6-like N-terminal domain-containing protein n=1 Tax=Calocera cornea HHB12733 TaxID=1353952 RepID=A0A165DQJ8_9BASI|nr:hypothetical protein CALCODRAFT_501265 [Calocera cornea HHB12733]
MAHLAHTRHISLPPSPSSVQHFSIPAPATPSKPVRPGPAGRLLLPALFVRKAKDTPLSSSRSVRSERERDRNGIDCLDAGQATEETGEDVLALELSPFVLEEADVELEGYQLYAVEKWVVEREKLLPTITVWTGDPTDKITVAVLRLSDPDTPFDKATHSFRQHGARAMEHARGTIMVTSLATFRSDLNIVHIPGGVYANVSQDLAVNIALSRLGCSGRRALTLEPPSQAAQDKFLQIYHLTASTPFSLTVITLIKLVQSALFIFGCFPPAAALRDGLLCDTTEKGLQKWMNEIGEPVYDLEPSGRILDDEVVAALLSSVTGARQRLAASAGRIRGEMGGRIYLSSSDVPKDPLAHPTTFLKVLAVWQKSQKMPVSWLNAQTITQLKADQPRQRRLSDPHRATMSRAFRQKLDEALPVNIYHGSGHELDTTDLEKFARYSVVKGGEGLDSVRWLWTGRARPVLTRQGQAGDVQNKPWTRADDGGDDDNDSFAGSVLQRGTGKVAKRSHQLMEGLTGWRRDILDFGRHRKTQSPESDVDVFRSPRSRSPQTTLEIPSLVVTTSLDDDTYPTAQSQREPPGQPRTGRTNGGVLLATPSAGRSAQSSWSNLSDTLNNQAVPSTAPPGSSRFPPLRGKKGKALQLKRSRPAFFQSQSDSVLRELEFEDYELPAALRPGMNRAITYYEVSPPSQVPREPKWRRHSFSCPSDFQGMRRVAIGRLKTDVDLCQALMDMREREDALHRTLSTMQSLVYTQRETIAAVQTDLKDRRAQVDSLQEKARQLIIDPTIRRRPGDGIEPTLIRVQRAGDELGRLKYTYEVTDDQLREVESMVWGLTRRINESGVRDMLEEEEHKQRLRGVGPDGRKLWLKGGQRLRSRLVDWGMWSMSLWDWARGRKAVVVPSSGAATPTHIPMRTPSLSRLVPPSPQMVRSQSYT